MKIARDKRLAASERSGDGSTVLDSYERPRRRVAERQRPMNMTRLILISLMVVLVGCEHSVRSRGFTRRSTDGIVYCCEVTHVDSSVEPLILLARVGGRGKDYSMRWETSHDRVFVDGRALAGVSAPTVYYSEDGKLKTMAISKSGVWLPLFNEKGPSIEELERVFDQIGHSPEAEYGSKNRGG
jgi:hypothetical protein